MFKKIKTAALSAVIGLGTLAVVPATAQADSFYFGITPNGPSFGFHGESSRRWDRDRRYDNRRHHRRFERRDCTEWQAVDKAQRMGVHRVYVRGENRHVIRIGGRKRGHRVAITFAKAPNCPVVGWRG